MLLRSDASDHTVILNEAISVVNGPREEEYGAAKVSFTRIATLWSAILGVTVPPYKVALCMALLKASRARESPHKTDSFVDGAAYFALAGELANLEP